MIYPFQIFGSASSIDYDIIIFVDKLGSIQENHQRVSEFEIELKEILKDKPINANLGVLENGKLIQVFKGYPFEVNNSCYYTYNNHKQYHSNQITGPLELTEDIIHFKLKRCLRFILSFYSRVPEWREDIKKALKGPFDLRLEQALKIDFTKHIEFPNKKEKVEDIYKVIAFQIAQTSMLYHNCEIYSKEEAIYYFPELSNFLERKPFHEFDLVHLNQNYGVLLMLCKAAIIKMKSLEEEILNGN